MPVRPFVLLGAVVVAGGALAMQQLGIGPFGGRTNPFAQSQAAGASTSPGQVDGQFDDQAAIRTSAVRSSSEPVSPEPLSSTQFEGRIAQNDAAPAASAPPAPAAQNGPVVDETALRYFAARGDTVRLEAEIARLRALYPTWTPPENPLAAAPQGDPQLDQMWKLYSEGKIADVRKAISDRQTREPEWQVPADLLERLALAEAREQLVNASAIKQYDTVIRVASSNPAMLTCGDVDVLWRVAEAFALSNRKPRAIDAYLYILNSCEKPEERLATVQKAMVVLSRADLAPLLAVERTVDGKPEFESVRGEIARRAIIEADADLSIAVVPADLALVEKLASAGGQQSDDLLLGWYYLRRDNPALAETWFRKAFTKQNDAASAQGMALALINLDQPQAAENILYPWRDTSEEVRAVYMAAVANMLAIQPPPAFPPEVLQRAVAEVAKAKDAASAQQLGWYADSFNQFETAARWFRTALEWKSDDEPSAYGLALMAWKLGDRASMQAVQTAWAGRSERIPTVGEPSIQTAALEARKRQQIAVGPASDPGAPRPIQTMSVAGPAIGQQIPPQPAYPQPVAQQPYQQPAYPQPVQQQPLYQQPVQQVPVYQQPMQQQPAQQQPIYQQPAYPQPVQPYSQTQQPYYPSVAQQPGEAPQQAAAVSYSPDEPRAARSQPRRSGKGDRVRPSGCRTTTDPEGLSPQAALTRGWCLMEANRPIEAAKAFEVALRGDGQTKSDAAYGQSLAYMRVGMTDSAAVAATKAPFNNARRVEVSSAMLAARANSAFQNKRYVETLLALDERARISPELTDLMVLRGYAYLNLKRFGDAERVFRAAAATGNSAARRGLVDLWAERNPQSNPY